jgi:multicomponent Na+:H+ antiporter subunit B
VNAATRQLVFWLGAAVFLGVLLAALLRLPAFGCYRGPYGDIISRVILPERHTPQSVAAVTFDYRGFDTLGEEYIFLTAVTGTVLLMRLKRHERQTRAQDKAADHQVLGAHDAVRAFGALLFAGTLLFGAYIVIHGHLTPGGGFQGGVLLASAFLYIYLCSEVEPFHELAPMPVFEILETLGAGGYVVLGLVGLTQAAYLQNILPLGQPKSLFSAGTLPVLNILVGTEVLGGLILVVTEFLRQALEIEEAGK